MIKQVTGKLLQEHNYYFVKCLTEAICEYEQKKSSPVVYHSCPVTIKSLDQLLDQVSIQRNT